MLRVTIIFLLLGTTPGWAQTEITWEMLADVTFTDKYSEEVDAYYYYPEFGASVKALAGQPVYLQGYMLTIDTESGIYILSQNPFAACFFCGSGGPESIVELRLKPDHPRFLMDQIVTIQGRLRLNQDDINACNYILEEAEVYEE
jgi:hypothetical protein